MNKHYPPEIRERTVRLVHELQDNYRSEWAAVTSIVDKICCTAETLRHWVRQAQVDKAPAPASPALSVNGYVSWNWKPPYCPMRYLLDRLVRPYHERTILKKCNTCSVDFIQGQLRRDSRH